MSEPSDEKFKRRTAEVGIDRAAYEEMQRQENERAARVDALLREGSGPGSD